MNYLVILNGIIYLGAAVFSFNNGRVEWSVIWLCYGVSAILLGVLER